MPELAVIHRKGQTKGQHKMGMAASQARLLCITARIHDVEYQAQSIQSAKVQLATQQDQVYNDYINALDADVLTLSIMNSDGTKSTIAANFNTLCSANRANAADGQGIALFDNRGRLIVENDVFDNYKKATAAGLTDPYQMALYMALGEGYTRKISGLNLTETAKENGGILFQDKMKLAEQAVYESISKSENPDKNLDSIYNSLTELTGSNDIYNRNAVKEEDRETYDELLKQYRNRLYTNSNYQAKLVQEAMKADSDSSSNDADFNLDDILDNNLFRNYLETFLQIQANNGNIVPISDFDGPQGDAANNSDWLTAMVQCGAIRIERSSTDRKGNLTLSSTSPASDQVISYTDKTSVDSTASKKAQAKYEHDLKNLESKDKKFDMDLSKLETERTALTTEYNSVKKVIEDNIDRTFGIFS